MISARDPREAGTPRGVTRPLADRPPSCDDRGVLKAVFGEPRYYLYGVLIVLAVIVLAFVFFVQTGTSSGGG